MNDCECGAHYLQNCFWWCGQKLTAKEIWERENPVAAEVKKLKEQVEDLKNIVRDHKEQGE